LIHAICVAGARPNLVKIKPVLSALEAVGARTTFVHTGQHYDEAMSGVFLKDLGLRDPDLLLGVGSGTHAEQTARVMTAFEPVVTELRPDVVVVVGDVNSTLGCALVAAKAGVKVAHVEAGLRSRDWSMPEEVNRVVVDRISDYLFAPSGDAVDNLRGEGYRRDQIHLVGNVMVDALLANLPRALELRSWQHFGVEPGRYALATLHRPANVDDQDQLEEILGALSIVSADLPVLFPVHPRTRSRIDSLGLPDTVIVTDPCGYLDFIALEHDAAVVVTDSGGVQEETTVLGVPCITVRDNTERPITVTEGTNQVVGRSAEKILLAARQAIGHDRATRRPALWDGLAAPRIAAVLVGTAGQPIMRPTELERS
jgi:UDP-N-acetylglucosamine 2-epimerase (non-hydrolysing)